MSPARVAISFVEQSRAPSLASAVVMRARISSSVTTRRVVPRRAAAAIASVSISGSSIGVAAPGLVAIPAGARLLPEAPHLDETIRDVGCRPATGGAARFEMLAGFARRHRCRRCPPCRTDQPACRTSSSRDRSGRPTRLPRAADRLRGDTAAASGWPRSQSRCRRPRRLCRDACRASAMWRSFQALVSLPRTISSSFMTLAGLKK